MICGGPTPSNEEGDGMSLKPVFPMSGELFNVTLSKRDTPRSLVPRLDHLSRCVWGGGGGDGGGSNYREPCGRHLVRYYLLKVNLQDPNR